MNSVGTIDCLLETRTHLVMVTATLNGIGSRLAQQDDDCWIVLSMLERIIEEQTMNLECILDTLGEDMVVITV